MEDDPGIYFIRKGTVKLYTDLSHSSILLKELKVCSYDFIFLIQKEGDFFGERSFFTFLPREFTAISDKFTTLFMIKRSDFINIIQKSKEDFVNYKYLFLLNLLLGVFPYDEG